MTASDEIDDYNWTWGHIAASLCHGSSTSVRHSQPVLEALVRFFLGSDRLQDKVQSWCTPLLWDLSYAFLRVLLPDWLLQILPGIWIWINNRWNLCARCSREAIWCRILWVGVPGCLHEGSHARLLFDLRLVGPFSWSLANGAVFVSCGYYMLNCWNVVSYLNTISPSNGDDQIFHVATVLFASVVLCIGICSLSYFSSSHPMIFDM